MMGDVTMPTFDPTQKRMSTQLSSGDVALNMENPDEMDNAPGNELNKHNFDTISINSASTANSEMVLISSQEGRRPRRPISQETPGTDRMIDNRGYIRPDQQRGARSRSPSPNNQDLSIENLRQFENGSLGVHRDQRGRARSLMDLRVAALTGEAQKQGNDAPLSNLYKSKSIENILTGQVHRLVPQSSPNGSTTSEARNKGGRGIWAQQKRREMQDSAF